MECGIDMRYFQPLGLWQFIQNNNRSKWVLLNFFIGSIFIMNISVQLLNTLIGGYEFSIFTEKFSVNLTVMESAVKIIYYCTKRSQLYTLSDCFKGDLLLCSQHDPVRSKEIMISAWKRINTVTKCFVGMIFFTVGVWNMLPILKCMAGDCSEWNIMPSWYPKSIRSLHILVYAFEFCVMIYCAALLYNVNCFFSALAISMSAQFELLCDCFSSIEKNAETKDEFKREKMDALLKECLIDHQTLLRFTKKLEEMYNPMFLFQMLTSTFTICLVLVQLNVHTSNNNELPVATSCKFFMYLVFGSMELLVYSLGGQIIHDKSGEVQRSLYETGWTRGSASFKKNVLIALCRAQRPESLTAGKFYTVDLNSFFQIIKASYSYFTFLHGSGSIGQ